MRMARIWELSQLFHNNYWTAVGNVHSLQMYDSKLYIFCCDFYWRIPMKSCWDIYGSLYWAEIEFLPLQIFSFGAIIKKQDLSYLTTSLGHILCLGIRQCQQEVVCRLLHVSVEKDGCFSLLFRRSLF